MKKIAVLLVGTMVLGCGAAWAGESAPPEWAQPVFLSPSATADAEEPAGLETPSPAVEEATGEIPPPRPLPPDGAETEPGRPESDRVRIALGVRCLGAWLTEDEKGEPYHGSFIGSIYRLKAKENWAPIHPYAQVTFAVAGGWRLGVGATYSHLGVETLDNGGGDGDIIMDMLLGYVVAEYGKGLVRPFAEAGGGVSFNTFDEASDWAGGGKQSFELENSPACYAALGCALALGERFALDAYVRYLHCDVDGTYVYKGDSRPDTDFTFTTSHVAAGLGVRYVF